MMELPREEVWQLVFLPPLSPFRCVHAVVRPTVLDFGVPVHRPNTGRVPVVCRSNVRSSVQKKSSTVHCSCTVACCSVRCFQADCVTLLTSK
jgi:hypothetical protein